MVFCSQNFAKMRWRPGLHPGPTILPRAPSRTEKGQPFPILTYLNVFSILGGFIRCPATSYCKLAPYVKYSDIYNKIQ